jgi:hypothetical protein
VPAECAGVRSGKGGQLDCRQGEDEGEKVEEDMGRVGEKGQGVGPYPPGNLGQESQGSQGDCIFEAACYAFVQVYFAVHQVETFLFPPVKGDE